MAKPLEGGIAKLVAKGLKQAKMTVAATLIKVTAGTRTGGAVSGGTHPTESSYSARGFVDSTKRDQINGTLVETNDRVVYLVAQSIASGQVPTTKDKITIEGATVRIVAVDRDPAAAGYACLTRA